MKKSSENKEMPLKGSETSEVAYIIGSNSIPLVYLQV